METGLAYINLIPSNQRAQFADMVYNLATYMGCPANHIMVIMHFESMGTMSPSKWNDFGYVGLIQFGTAAAADLGVTTQQLAQMSHVQQMAYVSKYFVMRVTKYGKPKNFADLYLYVNKPEWVKYGRYDIIPASAEYKQNNPSLVSNGNVTKQGIYNMFASRYGILLSSPGQNPQATKEQQTSKTSEFDVSSFMPLFQIMIFWSIAQQFLPKRRANAKE